jgi:hypothetical protein
MRPGISTGCSCNDTAMLPFPSGLPISGAFSLKTQQIASVDARRNREIRQAIATLQFFGLAAAAV